MPADPVDLAEIELLKDTMLAEYQVRNLRWNAVVVAGLGIIAVGLAGYITSSIDVRGLLAMLAAGTVLVLAAATILWWTDRRYEREAVYIRNRLRSLKGRSGP